MPAIARVALPRPVRQFFDYSIPQTLPLTPGQRVRVPFGHQTLTGLVMEVLPEAQRDYPLKPVAAALEDWPALPGETIRLLLWAARYYQHPPGECVFSALPPALRRGAPVQRPQQPFWYPAQGADPVRVPARARKQQQLMEHLLRHPGQTASELKSAGFSRPQLNSLREKGLALESAQPPQGHASPERSTGQPLNPLSQAQQRIHQALLADSEGFACHLLHGITGSGKTEIYLHFLARMIESSPLEAPQCLVLVPEINLTPQTLARFRHHFGTRVAVWHSALNASERLATWLRVRDGEPVVLIGTRSAVLLPFTGLAAMIVDEEHDGSYKQNEGFRYSARDLAIYRARLNQCPVVLGSATPSLESLYNARNGRYHLHSLTERAGNARLPTMQLLDIRSRPLQGGLAAPLLEALKHTIAAGEQALLFINRRGYAPVIMCYDCGTLHDCPRCDARLTFHRRDNCLRCHHCGFQQAIPRACSQCKSDNLHPVGLGTERTETVLEQLFPDTPVLRIDRDTTSRRGQLDSLLERVRDGGPCILVGTQMLAKGHDFPGVTLVGVLNADGGLFSSDFRGPEHLSQLLLQVSGRAGRGERPGQVVIQTGQSEHPLLNTLIRGDYLSVADTLLQERRDADLPPASHMTALRVDAPTMEESLALLDRLQQLATDADPGVTVMGPFPAVMARKANRHRANLLLQHSERKPLHQLGNRLCLWLEQQKLPRHTRWYIDVDPVEIE
ncbi:MAG: primosomal protein N' [Oleiphilaceae bacterium]|nr:primosomal protein N' [Oleiphilaceae bacterium]